MHHLLKVKDKGWTCGVGTRAGIRGRSSKRARAHIHHPLPLLHHGPLDVAGMCARTYLRMYVRTYVPTGGRPARPRVRGGRAHNGKSTPGIGEHWWGLHKLTHPRVLTYPMLRTCLPITATRMDLSGRLALLDGAQTGPRMGLQRCCVVHPVRTNS